MKNTAQSFVRAARRGIARPRRYPVCDKPRSVQKANSYQLLHTLGSSSLVQCRLHTGRTHQIRVHMKHIGHPLLGDSTYGRPARQQEVPRVMLHAHQLAFTHPALLKRMQFTAKQTDANLRR